MEEFEIPIFQKIYKLYKDVYGLRKTVPKQDRYTLWQKCENLILEILENILLASQLSKIEKMPVLIKSSSKLNLLRVFIRLCRETRVIDNKKYIFLQGNIDEIGRMLGGWIKSTKNR